MARETSITVANSIKPDPGFINLLEIDDSIIVDLKYATTDNFTGQVIYDFTTAVARIGTAKKLGIAAQLFKAQGYRIKIWDAYRPTTAQKRLYEVYPDDTWVAQPNPNYSHEKGVTFDMTLTDLAGHELPMQSEFDDFSDRAKRNYPRNREQERYYQLLNTIMTKADFHGYENEWWDFMDNDADAYEPMQVDPNDYRIE
ncbi:M15 family metallopeptidase [Secundilactobacillus similis DSM 23365 = JCM 2765]|uniref:D-alanyl-D-alanine dipeptidase n=1 Tax=Secundilactobacillus similis DSM 23365 = JCM 2765 TaxID=1423804 RepID=A0A0R2FEG3_9LACO|nr:M15 family metallopeptidase [Secundilactobacillus similis]KRN25755.1 peptidase M15D vanX D-ala-D-ala dipeptidase [Secundilactobacillus similis DSM 23365 = JCM 2765]